MTKLPDLPADTSGASGSGPTRAAIAKDLRSGGILLVRITDAAAAGDWVKKTMAAKGLSVSSSQYAAAQLITGTPTAGGPTASVAVLPDLMILGETSNVKTVVDANGKGGLAGTAGFQTAAKAVATENLAAWFVNVRQYVTWFSSVGAARGMASCPAITDTIPEWVGGAMTAESTALTSESVLPHVAGGPSTTNVRSTLPSHLPASTLLMLDRHDAGASIVQAVDKARSCAGPNAEVFDRIDSAIQGMGGWSGLTGWIGETALVVARDGDEPTGGVAVVPVDAAKADAFKTQLKNLLVLAGSSITSTEETYAGTTLTVISSPKEGAAAPKVAFAFTDDVVAFGLESWVKQVLDTKPEASLASDARFKTALDQARAENTSLAYANVTGLREWAESAMPASAAAKYERWAPWLRPFDAFAATASVGNDLDRFDTALTVR